MPTCLSWNSGTAPDLQFPTEHPEIPPKTNFILGSEDAVIAVLCLLDTFPELFSRNVIRFQDGPKTPLYVSWFLKLERTAQNKWMWNISITVETEV
jgi:hypothetical protein